MPLEPGFRLGPYEIVGRAGSGGMGEVYKALDMRLRRTVAIKVIPASLAADESSRERFEREARVVSGLRHPNICALYDVGFLPVTDGNGIGPRYLVLEYLEGETIQDRLKRGPLPLSEVIRYGVQIADALSAAHREGILHRDLKPSNIMITRHGASLLDFGIAKFVGSAARGDAQVGAESFQTDSATPEKPLTQSGAIVGTLQYMAPEQLEGASLDARSDVFSLGMCLYEMATGRRPFVGSTRAELLHNMRASEPPAISTIIDGSPADLDWLVRLCLLFNRDERIQNAHDVALALRRLSQSNGRDHPVGARPMLPWLIAVASVLAAAAIWMARPKSTPAGDVAVRRTSVALPSSAPLTDGLFEKLAVSPDGKSMVYVTGNENRRLQMFSLVDGRSSPLAGTERAEGPFFSPDGRWVGFYTDDGDLKKVSVDGGDPILLSRGHDIRGATWGPADTIVFGEALWSPLQRISSNGGPVHPLTAEAADKNVRWPTFLPDGDNVLYTVNDYSGDYENAKLAVLSLRTGTSKIILDNATFGRYVPSGHIIYLHGGTVFAVPFDLSSLSVTGPASPVIGDVDWYFAQGLAHVGVLPDSALIYIQRDPAAEDRELVWIDRSGNVTPMSSLRRPFSAPKLSPDDKRLAVSINHPPQSDIWRYDIDRDIWTRLTQGAENEFPIWSADGEKIAFTSNRLHGYNLFVIPSDGSAAPRQVTNLRSWPFANSWSPDGKTIAMLNQSRATFVDIYLLDLEHGNRIEPLVTTASNEYGAAFSPDGKWIAYHSDVSGDYDVYVCARRRPELVSRISNDGGMYPSWRRDGKELFYRRGRQLLAVTVDGSASFSAGRPHVLFEGDYEAEYDVASDGRRFVFARHATASLPARVNVVSGVLKAVR